MSPAALCAIKSIMSPAALCAIEGITSPTALCAICLTLLLALHCVLSTPALCPRFVARPTGHFGMMAAPLAGPAAAITARLGALKAELDGAEPGLRGALSESGSKHLAEQFGLVPKKDLKSNAATWLVAINAMAIHMRPEDSVLLIHTLADLSVSKKSWSMQNFIASFQYFLEDEWKQWKSEGFTEAQAQHMIFHKARLLGCDKPSEATTKMWVSAVLVRTLGPERAMSLTEEALKDQHKKLKTAWKNFRDNWKGVFTLSCEELHASPAGFKADHSDIYEKAFGELSPVICQIDLQAISQVDSAFYCRGSTCRPRQPISQLQLAPQAPGGSVNNMDGNFFSMGVRLMDQMQKSMVDTMTTLHQQQTQALQRIHASPRSLCDSPPSEPDDRLEIFKMKRSNSFTSEPSPGRHEALANLRSSPEANTSRLQADATEPAASRQSQEECQLTAEGANGLALLRSRDKERADENATRKGQEQTLPKKRPAAACSVVNKRPAGSVSAPVLPKKTLSGNSIKPIDVGLPKGWSAWCVGDRKDKYYQAPDGTRFVSRQKVDEYLGKARKA